MASTVNTIDLQMKKNDVYPAPNNGQVPVPPGYVAPQAPVMMPVPQRPAGCPPGLEYLTQIDQLLVHQKIELAEVILGWESNNKYLVKNTLGQQVFYVAEENDCCTRQCCGPMRSFVLHVQDNMGQEVMTLTRSLRCSSCCCPCCLQELEVQAPPGTPVGYVIQKWHPFLPKFTVQNERREDVLKIQGPFCACNCCSDVNFEVLSLDESAQVGRISKQWTGILQEAFTDADNFGIKFPTDLDVKVKAVLFGACFLIGLRMNTHERTCWKCLLECDDHHHTVHQRKGFENLCFLYPFNINIQYVYFLNICIAYDIFIFVVYCTFSFSTGLKSSCILQLLPAGGARVQCITGQLNFYTSLYLHYVETGEQTSLN